jgi:hypothetical protein
MRWINEVLCSSRVIEDYTLSMKIPCIIEIHTNKFQEHLNALGWVAL